MSQSMHAKWYLWYSPGQRKSRREAGRDVPRSLLHIRWMLV
jgi:hypothetical protein